jgi:hypothetical protein
MRKRVGSFTILALLSAALSAAPALAEDFKARLKGYQEVPAISTAASGEFKAKLDHSGTAITYELTYSGLAGGVRQSHIHFGQRSVNGGIVIFLCQTATNPDPTGLAPTCPQEGTVTGVLTVANMTAAAAGQGIAVGEFAELIEAMRAGVTYANVHSSVWPAGEIRGQIKK